MLITMSHDIISKQMPEAKISGVKIEEKNNITFNLNLCLKLMIWMDDETVEEARTLYFKVDKFGTIEKLLNLHELFFYSKNY